MGARDLDAVTGAFGFSGKAIAARLLALGHEVRTLTNHPGRGDPFGGRVAASPLDFSDPAGLRRSLEGVGVLHNTYWIRFPRGRETYARAVASTEVLLRAAREAGVRRVVHVSIANPSADSSFLSSSPSSLPYYSGKAAVEAAVAREFPSHAIVRPTVIFGPGDILINNIAWFLRRFPVFLLPGRGDALIQPVFVEDVAELAVRGGLEEWSGTADAAGPERFTFRELVGLIAAKIGSRARIQAANAVVVRALLGGLGSVIGDVVLTRDEIEGLNAGLLASREPSRCPARITDWLEANRETVGARYASEIARHYK